MSIPVRIQISSASGGKFSNSKGDAHFPPNKLQSLMTVCGNQIPLQWLARSYGYELVQIETETQRLLNEERARREEVERENKLMRDLIQGKR